MPQALASALVPVLSQFFLSVGLPSLAFGATIGAIALGVSYAALAVGAYFLASALTPKVQAPEVPKPEDGKYNLKQSVPPLTYVLGRVKKAGDYAFLEEKGGTAFHITVWAAHHIKGFVTHYLHDEAVTLDGSGFVTAPAHFVVNGDPKVRIQSRRGEDAETHYAVVANGFPSSIWGPNHRGDGLASVMMYAKSVAAEDLQKTFTSGMPQHSVIGEGHDRLIDPRTGNPGYSTNLAIFRYWHLSHPVGGKLSTDDLYTPDWANAANVCDENVTNRSGGTEKRYHGGFWFRANNDPVAVGRTMDQAAELVIYERADGLVGVHAGKYAAPDVRLTANDLLRVNYDANKREETTVLAVRGRYTSINKGYNTADAAIYGVPYPSDDERTKTVENTAVQSHNHMARLQKLAYIRANAPRVRLLAHYEPAREVPYRRFIRVHYPPKMVEAVIEITGRPTLSLRNLTYEIEGIVLPGDIYPFNAATEEGAPGTNVDPVTIDDVPVPAGFAVVIKQEAVSGGSLAAYAEATVSFQNDAFQYEFEWQPTSGGVKASVFGGVGELVLKSAYLADGVQYRFRARTWSGGASSNWTGYITLTVTADPNPPGQVTGVSATGGAGQIAFDWTAPNSANYAACRIYLNTSNSFSGSTLAATEFGAANTADSRTVTGLSAGTYYGFLVAINASGVAAAEVATGAVTVT